MWSLFYWGELVKYSVLLGCNLIGRMNTPTEMPIYLQNLQVQWDSDTNCNHKNRVSPWEIERVDGTNSVTTSSSKRTKLCFPESDLGTSCISKPCNMKLIG
jgi:hypothetical protein